MIRADKAMRIWRDAQDVRYALMDDEGMKGYSSGMSDLDNIDRFKHPFYAIIVAKNKAGKTALMLSIGLAMAKQKMVVLFNSLEMSTYQMCNRMASNMSKVDMQSYDRFQATPDDWENTDRMLEEISKYDFYLTEGKNTPGKLEKEIADLKLMHPDRKILVIVDYVQLMEFPGNDGDYQEKTALSRWFKRLTLDPNRNEDEVTVETMLNLKGDAASILTAVQVTAAYKRSGARITDASASGTPAYGNDGDYLISLNDVVDDDGTIVPNRKHLTLGGRFTGGGEFVAFFNRAQARFEDMPKRFSDEAAEPIAG